MLDTSNFAGHLNVGSDPFLIMHFAHPQTLWLLLLCPLTGLIAMGYWIWKRRVRKRLGHRHLVEAMAAERSARRQWLRVAAFIAALGSLVVAAAQPQWGQTSRTIKRTGVDLVFALDLSKSMLAEDIPPSRLAAAKNEIESVLQLLAGDRVGMVVFTAVSFAQSPLTTDYGAIRFYLDKLHPEQMPFGGTSIGHAIVDAVELLTGRDQAQNKENSTTNVAPKRAKTQVVVIVTDGEDHESDPRSAAEIAAKQGIRIVTIGMGSKKGERIPVLHDNGQFAGYKRNREGEFVTTSLDVSALKSVAEVTGGRYIPYAGENSVANALVDYVNTLEKTELETLYQQRYYDRFVYFLLPGVLLLLFSMGLGERRTTSSIARIRRLSKRWSASGSLWLVAGLLSTIPVLSGCDDLFRQPVAKIEEGNRHLKKQEFDQAAKAYRAAQGSTTLAPELHYNLGLALLGAGQFDDAQEAFARALATDEPRFRFEILYNLGLVLAKQEKWTESFESFKEALRMQAIHPGVIPDEQVRRAQQNLEIAFREMYPPCVQLDDEHEDNDTAENATALGKMLLEKMTLCGGDADWFAIPVVPGTKLSLEATFRPLRNDPDPEYVFLPAPPDLQLAVFDPSGEKVLAVDQGLEEHPDATQSPPAATRQIDELLVSEDMLGAHNTLLIKAQADEELEFRYDLNITAIPPCTALEDDFENNDQPEDAKPLKDGVNQLHLCPQNQDWFRIEAKMGDTFFVDVTPQPDPERGEPPAINVTIFDSGGRDVVARAHKEGALLSTAVWDVEEDTTFLLRIEGQEEQPQGPYTVQLYQYAPCVEGNDRYEQNDRPGDAAQIDAQMPMHRYLRLCPEDLDFFKIPLTSPDANAASPGPSNPQAPQPSKSTKKGNHDANKLALGLSVVPKPKSEEDAERETRRSRRRRSRRRDEPEPVALAFDLMSESGDQIVKKGIAVAEQNDLDKRDAPGHKVAQQKANGAASLPVDLTMKLEADDLTQNEVLVRVKGPPLFYHLIQMNPSPSEQDGSQNTEDQSSQQQQTSQSDPKEADDSKGKSTEENQASDDSSPEGKQEQAKKDALDANNEQGHDPPPDPNGDQKSEQSRSEPSQSQSNNQPGGGTPAEVRRIEDMLKALETTDNNFQMRKALENMPGRYIEKDW